MPRRPAPYRLLHGHLARRRSSHSYGYVLLAICLSFLFAATAPDAAWATSTLVLIQTVTLCAGLWTSGIARAGSLVNIGVLTAETIAAVIGLFHDNPRFSGFLAVLSGILTIATVLVLAL